MRYRNLALAAVVLLFSDATSLAQTEMQMREKVKFEAALRVQGFICDKTADLVGLAPGLTVQDLVKCRISLEKLRVRYFAFMRSYYR